MPLPAKFAEAGQKPNGDVADVAWWTAFRDPKLTAYVEAGLQQNLDIQQAVERINAADANVVVAGSGSLPSLSASAEHTVSGTKGELSTTNATKNTTAAGLGAGWLLDLFGEYAKSKESAKASLDAAYATADVARLTYLSSIVASYIDARYYQEQIALANKNLKSRRETLSLTKLQLEAGSASQLDVVQAEGLVNSAIAEIPGMEVNFRVSVHHMSTLLGMPASTLIPEMQRGARQPMARINVRAGVPADLIRNRPDIRAAERNLAAAIANIGVAEAKLYPSITLSGSIAPAYITQGNTKGGLTSWSFGPSLNLPILDGGRNRANVKSAQSQAQQAYLTWKSTVLAAVEDVENALAAVSRDARTVSALRDTVGSYQKVLEFATENYKNGASSLLDILDAQRSVSASETNLAAAIRQMARDYVALNVAIGSGYSAGSGGKI